MESFRVALVDHGWWLFILGCFVTIIAGIAFLIIFEHFVGRVVGRTVDTKLLPVHERLAKIEALIRPKWTDLQIDELHTVVKSHEEAVREIQGWQRDHMRDGHPKGTQP